MNIESIGVAFVMIVSSVGLIYSLSKSRRASRTMSVLIANVLLAVTCVHFIWPTIPINGFTMAVVSLLGVPGVVGITFIQNYLL